MFYFFLSCHSIPPPRPNLPPSIFFFIFYFYFLNIIFEWKKEKEIFVPGQFPLRNEKKKNGGERFLSPPLRYNAIDVLTR